MEYKNINITLLSYLSGKKLIFKYLLKKMTDVKTIIKFAIEGKPQLLKHLKPIVQYFKDGKIVYDDHNTGMRKFDTKNFSIMLNVNKNDEKFWCSIIGDLDRKYFRYHCRNTLYWKDENLHQSVSARSLTFYDDAILNLIENGYIDVDNEELSFMNSKIILIKEDLYDWILSL